MIFGRKIYRQRIDVDMEHDMAQMRMQHQLKHIKPDDIFNDADPHFNGALPDDIDNEADNPEMPEEIRKLYNHRMPEV